MQCSSQAEKVAIIAEVMVSKILINHSPTLTGSTVCAETPRTAETQRKRKTHREDTVRNNTGNNFRLEKKKDSRNWIGEAEREIRVKKERVRKWEGRTEKVNSAGHRGRREGMACMLADASPSCFLMRRSLKPEDKRWDINCWFLSKRQCCCVRGCNSWMLSVWSHASWGTSHAWGMSVMLRVCMCVCRPECSFICLCIWDGDRDMFLLEQHTWRDPGAAEWPLTFWGADTRGEMSCMSGKPTRRQQPTEGWFTEDEILCFHWRDLMTESAEI